MRWSTEKRLEFIEARLFWEGRISRKDLVDFFRISIPQATKDIKEYSTIAPNNLRYDSSNKRYEATESFSPELSEPSSERYLGRLTLLRKNEGTSSFNGAIPPHAIISNAGRFVDTAILQALTKTIHGDEAVNITYQSMSSPEPHSRWISPHALGSDGNRWHVRGLCHNSRSYKDFNLGRILSVNETSLHEFDHSADCEWHNNLEAKIKPNPKLSSPQKRVIEHEYCMNQQCAIITFKAAFLYYFIINFGFEEGYTKRPPERQQVVLANQDELEAQLKLLKTMTLTKIQELSEVTFF